jgi:hypothetical protein
VGDIQVTVIADSNNFLTGQLSVPLKNEDGTPWAASDSMMSPLGVVSTPTAHRRHSSCKNVDHQCTRV